MHYGLTADRDAIPDIEVVGQCITEALAELVDTHLAETGMRAPRGASGARQSTSPAKRTVNP